MTPEDVRIGRALRALRIRGRMRQVDLAEAVGVSQSAVSRAEGGGIGGISVASLRGMFAAVGARVEVRAVWDGASLDRLLDAGHAELTERVSRILAHLGWDVSVEVTYSIFGERGSIDILAWHEGTRSLLIVEIKTVLGSMEETLRTFDAKVRLGPRIARERWGRQASSVSQLLVLPEDRTMRRHVAAHHTSLRALADPTAWDVRRWLRDPAGPFAGLWFLSPTHGAGASRSPARSRRVRRTEADRPEHDRRRARPLAAAGRAPESATTRLAGR